MKRKIITVGLAAAIGVASFAPQISAVTVDPNTRACLAKKYGPRVADKIAASKKLTATQTKQLASCKTSSGGASSPSTSGGSTTSASLKALNYSLLWSVGSQQAGLGNVSDPALLQLADGTLRMFFKNGNEPQIPIAGFDNKIHSYVSRDNGATWTLESGVRIDVGSPVSVRVADSGGYEAWGWVPAAGGDALTRFTSTDGSTFAAQSGTAVPTSACKNANGAAAGFLGDAQVVKVAGGYLAYAHDLAAGKNAPFKRQACKLTSTTGTSWSVDATGTIALDYDIVNNPELYRNASGQLELLLPIDNAGSHYIDVRTSTNDGASWTSAGTIPLNIADPERLDLANGTSLLAFGNFDHTIGGLLAVAKKVTSPYSASRDEKVDSTTWTVSGAKTSDVKVKNLCKGTDVTSAAKIATSGSNLTVTYSASSVGCVYLVLGSSNILG